MSTTTRQRSLDPGFWIGVLCIIALFFLFHIQGCAQTTTTAKYDTIQCHIESIDEFVTQTSPSGKSTRIYAVYNDKQQDISEIISVSKSVFEYIQMCKEHHITPSLGIKLKNGVITSIIRYKPKYVLRRRN